MMRSVPLFECRLVWFDLEKLTSKLFLVWIHERRNDRSLCLIFGFDLWFCALGFTKKKNYSLDIFTVNTCGWSNVLAPDSAPIEWLDECLCGRPVTSGKSKESGSVSLLLFNDLPEVLPLFIG
jgi:hypothetical protein